jgi:outer membrane protein OmpA-like peptidoglycan-associated protein
MSLDDDKKREEIAKLKLDRLKSTIGLCVSVSSGIGIVAVFGYCFLIIGFIPTGLGMGDTLFFIFSMLAVALTGAALAGAGLLAFVPFILQKPAAGHYDKYVAGDRAIFWLGGTTLLAVFFLNGFFGSPATQHWTIVTCLWAIASGGVVLAHLLLCYLLVNNRVETGFYFFLWLILTVSAGAVMHVSTRVGGPILPVGAFGMLCTVLGAGGSVAVGLSMLEAPPSTSGGTSTIDPSKLRVAMMLIFAGVFLPYIGAQASGTLNYAMEGLGMRLSNATLIVNEANHAILEAAADAKGLPLYSCKHDDGTYAISNATILWHGMGQRSYVELLPAARATNDGKAARDSEKAVKAETTEDAGEAKGTPVRVELESAGVKKAKTKVAGSCIELRRGIYFASNGELLSQKEWSLSQPFVRTFLKENEAADKKIVAVGYADPMPRASESNFSLAQKRACDVVRHIADAKLGTVEQAWIDVRLDHAEWAGCKDLKDPAQQRSCFEKNRRVEVQLVHMPGTFVRVGTAQASEACGFTEAAPANGK